MTSILEKIVKLLALAESPNEGEAKAALLKARQLMAKHKLTEMDLKHLNQQRVKTITTDMSYTSMTRAWACDLGGIIAEHYCCRAFGSRTYGGKTSSVGFVGLEDDVEVCERVFRYAYDFINSESEQITKRFKKVWTGRQIREAKEAYGFGFVIGINYAFHAQDTQNKELALVMKTPKEVEDEVARQKWRSIKGPRDNTKGKAESQLFRAAGYAEGKNFDPSAKLEG